MPALLLLRLWRGLFGSRDRHLTGENKVTRVDILHDCGRSLNPAVDLGQIEGGFIQGMGWLTTEELVFDDKGALRTHAPSTYKIPAAGDRPTPSTWRSGSAARTRWRASTVPRPWASRR